MTGRNLRMLALRVLWLVLAACMVAAHGHETGPMHLRGGTGDPADLGDLPLLPGCHLAMEAERNKVGIARERAERGMCHAGACIQKSS